MSNEYIALAFVRCAELTASELKQNGYYTIGEYLQDYENHQLADDFEFISATAGNWTITVQPCDPQGAEFRLLYNDFPAGIISSSEGIMAAGAAANEDTLIAAIESELDARGVEYARNEEEQYHNT